MLLVGGVIRYDLSACQSPIWVLFFSFWKVNALAPTLVGNYTSYTKQYCNARRGRFGWDVNGCSNADELHCKLRQIMIRRLKVDVLDELPPKQRSIVPIVIPKSKRKECETLMKELQDTRKSIFDLCGDEAFGANLEARKLLLQAYQATGVAKADGVCDYVLDWIRGSGTQKVLIFAHHKAVLDAIETTVAKELKGAGHIRIDGSVSAQERNVRVKKFQSCSTIKVAILSMTAAGVGLTLTAATSVMFAELHWTPGVLAQAEDRCHRISQKNAVHVMYLVCEDETLSVDMQLWHMLGRKTNNLGRVVDGATDAGLDVQKSSECTTINSSSHERSTMSGQDELQSFFADAVHKNGKQALKTPTTKGTIMNFFAKQSSTNKMVTSSFADDEIKATISTSLSNSVEWDCEACTYHNSQRRTKSGFLCCEICRFQLVESNVIDLTANERLLATRNVAKLQNIEKTSLNQILPDGSGNAQNANSVVNLYAKDTIHATRSVTTRNIEPPTLNQVTPCGSRKPDNVIIDVDGIEDYDVRSCREDVWLDAAGYHGRKRKLSQHDESHRRHYSLAFAVSNNTGRITIYYAVTGESSLVNFDIEQIVTDETMDKIMEAKLKRNNELSLSFQLMYNDAAIRQGVLDCT
jgi:hypothetical protein